MQAGQRRRDCLPTIIIAYYFDLGAEINSQGLPAFSRTTIPELKQLLGTSGSTGNECTGFPLGP